MRFSTPLRIKRLPRTAIAMAIASMVFCAGASNPPQYKLAVGIIVEGLEGEWLEMLAPYIGEDGFRRLETNGVSLSNIDYGTPLDGTAAAAMLFTGAAPNINGIDCATVYDAASGREISVFADPTVLGNFSSAGFSPVNLAVSTIGDETRIAGGGINGVYALAPTASQAIVLAGHSGNLALWFNPANGQWASSTYYREIPASIAARNRALPLETRLDTMSWTPLHNPAASALLPEHLWRYPFRYVYPRGQHRIEEFTASPLANSEITRLAQELAEAVRLGSHSDGTDVLNIAYTLGDYDYCHNPDSRAEKIDAYLRLDRDLACLFAMIDAGPGMDNTLVYLAGTPPRPRKRRDDERWNIPAGEFSARRAISLLNLYLIAIHGNGDYVDGFHNNYIYLNRRLIKERGLDAALLRSQSAEFLQRMTGVAETFTLEQILAGVAGDNAAAMRRNTVPSKAGDVYLRISPGFEITETSAGTASERHLAERMGTALAPAFIMAPSVTPQRITDIVDARVIAPTVGRILRIRSPNGASMPPLTL